MSDTGQPELGVDPVLVKIQLKNTSKFFMEIYQGGRPPSYMTRKSLHLYDALSLAPQGLADLLLSDDPAGTTMSGLFPYRLTIGHRNEVPAAPQLDLMLLVRGLATGDILKVSGSEGVVPSVMKFSISSRQPEGWSVAANTILSTEIQTFELKWAK